MTKSHNIELPHLDVFKKLIHELGFKIVTEYDEKATGGENYNANFITIEKVADIPEYMIDALKFDSPDNAKYITELGNRLGNFHSRELISSLFEG